MSGFEDFLDSEPQQSGFTAGSVNDFSFSEPAAPFNDDDLFTGGGGGGGSSSFTSAPAPASYSYEPPREVEPPKPVLTALRDFHLRKRDELERKREQEAEDIRAVRTAGAAALEEFYVKRKAQLKQAASTKRGEEKLFLETLAKDEKNDNIWEKLTGFVDLQAKGDGKDVTRLRQVIIQMKADSKKH